MTVLERSWWREPSETSPPSQSSSFASTATVLRRPGCAPGSVGSPPGDLRCEKTIPSPRSRHRRWSWSCRRRSWRRIRSSPPSWLLPGGCLPTPGGSEREPACRLRAGQHLAQHCVFSRVTPSMIFRKATVTRSSARVTDRSAPPPPTQPSGWKTPELACVQ